MAELQRLLSLASGVLPEFSPEATAAAAAAAGWPAVGLWVEPAIWTAAATRAVRHELSQSGLHLLDVEVIWIKPGAFDPDHGRLLAIGAELGARNALAVSSDPDLPATADKLARLSAQASALGLRLSLEFAAFTAIRSLADALAMLARPGLEEIGLLIDPLHFARTGGVPPDMEVVSAERLSYAQFCDAPQAGPSADDAAAILNEAIDLRLLPGDGDLPLGAMLDRLPRALPLSVEIRSKALRDGYADAAERARVVLEGTRRMLESKARG